MLLVQTETKAKDQNMAEIEVLTEYGNVIAKYEGFETVYKELDGGMILSNDGTVYVEQPEQEPDVDQIRTAKLAEVSSRCESAIFAGVDVELTDGSVEHMGIDLTKVPCDFVIIKATQGTDYVNPDYDRAYQQAKNAGKCLGVYHYASGGDAEKEAQFFIENVSGHIGEAILVLDWEKEQNKNFGVCDFNWVKKWLNYVFKKTGVKPLIYTSKSFMNRFDGIGDFGMWIAQYASNDVTGYQETPWNEGAYNCAIRQYSSHGRLSGYAGNLDLDKFYGDKEAWSRYAAGTGKTENNENTSNVSGSTLEIAEGVMKGTYGDGDDRRKKLGSLYDRVQNFINHIATAPIETLVEETLAGTYGNGDTRKAVLGTRYDEVQNRINATHGNNSAIYYTVQDRDTLSEIAEKYGTTYQKIASMNGIQDPNKIYAGQKIRVK